MSIFITKIKLYNFRRFREFVIEPNTKNNILIGDNESGKSTILEAIDLVSGGNNRRVEAIGLDNLLNIEAVKYTDVCVLLNKTTSKKMAAGKLAELAPMTKNKLYVAITRAKGNVYIFDE